MAWWSPRRVVVFLTAWTLVMPFKVTLVIGFRGMDVSTIYAAIWGYVPGNPIYPSAIVVDILYSMFMLPYFAPGLAIAYFAWSSTTNQNMSRIRYAEIVLSFQMVHLFILWFLLPCPISYTPHLCIPTAVTGILALLFAPKRADRTASPWALN